MEGQLAYQVSNQFQSSMGAAYTDAQYKTFLTSPRFDQCLVPACGQAFGLFLTSTTNASGFRAGRSPKFTANVRARSPKAAVWS